MAYGQSTNVIKNIPTGDNNIDAQIAYSRWQSNQVIFSFTNDYEEDYEEELGYQNTENRRNEKGVLIPGHRTTFSPLNAIQQQIARNWMRQYEDVSGLILTEWSRFTGNDRHATIRIAASDNPGTAYAGLPNHGFEAGDIWFNRSDYNAPRIGNYAYHTFGHEIGHALGLEHGHETGGIRGVAMDFDRDSMEFSIMTYRSHLGHSANGYSNGFWDYAQTLMIYDIRAIQQMYGANFNTNANNTVYTFSTNTGEMFVNNIGQGQPGGNRLFRTIWDGNGIDTYQFSNYTTNLNVNLAPGHWSDLDVGGNFQRARLGRHQTARGHIFNALQFNGDRRSLIENAHGGTGHDTIVGNDAANQLKGNAGNDSLDGLIGDDSIYGGAGNDFLEGYVGQDSLDGGAGSDHLRGGPGHDFLEGFTGDDSLVGWTENDHLRGGPGNDTLVGGKDNGDGRNSGDDRLVGWTGDDIIWGGDGNDSIWGGSDFSKLLGSGKDNLNGQEGDDILNAGDEADTLNGGTGNDFLGGWSGNDIIYGENGNDTLYGDSGKDSLFGGDGNDRIFGHTDNLTVIKTLGPDHSKDIINGGAGNDTLDGGNGSDEIGGWTGNDLILGGNGNDIIWADTGNDTVRGGQGHDVIWGHTDNQAVKSQLGIDQADLLEGGAGNDTINGNGGDDSLWGGSGQDRLLGDIGDDLLNGQSGNDTLKGGLGNDTLVGIKGNDVLEGGAGNDRYDINGKGDRIIEKKGQGEDWVYSSANIRLGANLENLLLKESTATKGTGNHLNNIIRGNQRNNRLVGARGHDTLHGLVGRDQLAGGANNDLLIGGPGSDILTGGIGADSFRFYSPQEGGDSIRDFSRGAGDTIEIITGGFGGGLNYSGRLKEHQFSLGSRAKDNSDRFIYNRNNGQLLFDVDGVGGAEASLIATLNNKAALSHQDIQLYA